MLKFYTAGESHGQALLSFLSGLPAGLPIDLEFINRDLHRRQLGYGRGGRQKIEKDRADILGRESRLGQGAAERLGSQFLRSLHPGMVEVAEGVHLREQVLAGFLSVVGDAGGDDAFDGEALLVGIAAGGEGLVQGPKESFFGEAARDGVRDAIAPESSSRNWSIRAAVFSARLPDREKRPGSSSSVSWASWKRSTVQSSIDTIIAGSMSERTSPRSTPRRTNSAVP